MPFWHTVGQLIEISRHTVDIRQKYFTLISFSIGYTYWQILVKIGGPPYIHFG